MVFKIDSSNSPTRNWEIARKDGVVSKEEIDQIVEAVVTGGISEEEIEEVKNIKKKLNDEMNFKLDVNHLILAVTTMSLVVASNTLEKTEESLNADPAQQPQQTPGEVMNMASLLLQELKKLELPYNDLLQLFKHGRPSLVGAFVFGQNSLFIKSDDRIRAINYFNDYPKIFLFMSERKEYLEYCIDIISSCKQSTGQLSNFYSFLKDALKDNKLQHIDKMMTMSRCSNQWENIRNRALDSSAG